MLAACWSFVSAASGLQGVLLRWRFDELAISILSGGASPIELDCRVPCPSENMRKHLL